MRPLTTAKQLIREREREKDLKFHFCDHKFSLWRNPTTFDITIRPPDTVWSGCSLLAKASWFCLSKVLWVQKQSWKKLSDVFCHDVSVIFYFWIANYITRIKTLRLEMLSRVKTSCVRNKSVLWAVRGQTSLRCSKMRHWNSLVAWDSHKWSNIWPPAHNGSAFVLPPSPLSPPLYGDFLLRLFSSSSFSVSGMQNQSLLIKLWNGK